MLLGAGFPTNNGVLFDPSVLPQFILACGPSFVDQLDFSVVPNNEIQCVAVSKLKDHEQNKLLVWKNHPWKDELAYELNAILDTVLNTSVSLAEQSLQASNPDTDLFGKMDTVSHFMPHCLKPGKVARIGQKKLWPKPTRST